MGYKNTGCKVIKTRGCAVTMPERRVLMLDMLICELCLMSYL